jgi:starch phosphorylase
MSDGFSPTINKTFQVFPDIPARLEPLMELANNFWWMWNPDAVELFRRLDRKLWETVAHNPRKFLGTIPQPRLAEAAEDDGYLAHLKRVYAAFKQHMSDPGWYGRHHGNEADRRLLVAYFSAEFGIHESMQIYSGGLGVLAGDHLKSASELALPLIGVGLLYRNGYFVQYLSSDGWQQESYPELDFYNLPLEVMRYTDGTPVQVRVDLPDNAVFARVWRCMVGRIPLYLLDTNLAENSPADREITSKLYGGGSEMRIKQELVLGIGGVRAMEAMGIKPSVWHMNEGHAAFLALERCRMLLEADPNLTFDQARQFVMSTNVFTTHTPVPAGIDMFPPDMITKYFKNYHPSLKLNEDGFLALGREDVENKKQGFSMAVLAIRLADSYNGVSHLHGEVSRKMWHNIWPRVPQQEVPIRHVTNGIHTRTWLGSEISEVFDRYMGEEWLADPTDESVWDAITQVPDEELWRAHERAREKMVSWVRGKLKDQLLARNAAPDEVKVADEVLDPEALTIGFARRFATYKRGALLLRDVERLKRLLDDPRNPVQFVFAGKSHPADNEGKDLIRSIVQFARQPQYRRKFVFIENYDMDVARHLVQGVDVWLNTPRRPHEASGTSGMKAACNGVLNCSILDGWWVEGFGLDPTVGWAIGRGEQIGEGYGDANHQDTVECQLLFELLEKEIVPLFHDRGADNIPREWIGRMKNCIRRLAPVFNTNRMVRDYAEMFYVTAAGRGARLAKDGLRGAVELAKVKERLREVWNRIRIVGVHTSGNGHYKVGDRMQVEALLDLPELKPEDLQVQLYAGPINAHGQIDRPMVLTMSHTRQMAPDRHLFTGVIDCQSSGRQGFALRIVPGDPNMATPFEPGLITWN